MSVQTAGYRIGVWFFGTIALCSLLTLPLAYSQCADCSGHPNFRNNWEPNATPLAVALLDWPMGFRLLLITFVAAVLCLGAVTAMLHVAQKSEV